MAWDFCVLGPMEVWHDGGLLPGGSPKQRAVLALLLLRAGEVVPVSQVVAGVWGSDAPSRAVNNVQVQVSALRRALGAGGLLVSRHGGYLLDVPRDAVDMHRFESSLLAGRELLDRAQHEQAALVLRSAMRLWRGDPLEEFADVPFAEEARRRLQEQRLTGTLDRVQADLALGRHLLVLGELRALVRRWPLHGRMRAQLMLALYRSGQQADALCVFEEGRAVLAAELGVDPDPLLSLMHERILRQEPDLDQDPQPVVAPSAPVARDEPAAAADRPSAPEERPPSTTGALPRPAGPLFAAPIVGRQAEQQQVLELMGGGARLLTLIGPGGVGKTRLAAAVLEALGPSGPPSVWLSLSELTRAEDVLAQVAVALHVRLDPEADAVAHLAAALPQRCIVVLDNFEQVIDAATLLSSLLQQAPGLQVLVTSRVRLNVYAERVVTVGPLALPSAAGGDDVQVLLRSDAVQLFYLRAEALTGRPLGTHAAADVAEICRRLDGLPLAVELAAASCRHHAPQHVLTRLSSSLTALGPAPRDAPPRQQSLHAALDWSWALLTGEERHVLVGLSAFRGGFDPAAAAAVLDVPLPSALVLLDRLVDHSLLAGTGDGRFRMLSVVREYLHERLLATEGGVRVLARFCDWCQSFAAEMMSRQESWKGIGGAPGVLEVVQRELVNLTSALEWSAVHDRHRHALLLGAALPLLFMAGRLDQVERYDASLPLDALAGPESHRVNRALAGLTLTHQARPRLAEAYARRSLAALGDDAPEQTVWGSYNLAATLRCQGRVGEAVALLESARDVRRRCSVDGAGVLDGHLAELYDELGTPEIARGLADSYLASAVAEQTGDDVAYAWAQRALLLLDMDPAGVEQAVAESSCVLQHATDLTMPTRLDVLQLLTVVHLSLDRPAQAHPLLVESRELILEMQYHLLLPDHAALCAVWMSGEGELETAARLAGGVQAVRRTHGLVALQRRVQVLESDASSRVSHRLGPARFKTSFDAGETASRGTVAGLVALLSASSPAWSGRVAGTVSAGSLQDRRRQSI